MSDPTGNEGPSPQEPSEPPPTIKREPPVAGAPERDTCRLVGKGKVEPAPMPGPMSYPERIGEYELLEEVARGGMGIVFRARHIHLQRIVALKMVLHGQLAGEDNLQRFHLEAAATAQLQHPGIVAIYEVGRHESQPFFTMEFIDGTSLAQRVETGPLPGTMAARYLMLTARAVHFAHSRGILHRDLKPANILIDEHDQPKVTDFGLAKVLQSDSTQTRSGAIMGTPSYMAPEQALARKNLGPSCDIYSLGAILYELLTGRPCFRGETPMATMAMVIEQEPVPPRLLNPKLDTDLETICLKCLEKEPSRRYLSAEVLAEDLANHLEGKPIAARRLSRIGRTVKWCRRKPTAAALIAVSALLVAAVLAGGVAFGVVQQSLRTRADSETERARRAEEDALKAEETARRAEQRAIAQNRDFVYLLYVAQYRLARVAWEFAEIRRARAWLDRWQPSGGTDPRGWEWFYLNGLLEGKRALRLPGGKATALAFRSDGAWLATGDESGTVHIWDVATGKRLHALKTHDYNITALAFHPAGNWLAAAGDRSGSKGAIRVWSVPKGKEIYALEALPKPVRALAFSPDGRLLASGCDDGSVRLHDAPTGRSQRSWSLGKQPVRSVVFDAHSTRLAASVDRAAHVWDLKRDTPALVLPHDQPLRLLAFTAIGDTLLTIRGERAEHMVTAWDVAAAGAPLRSFPLPAPAWLTLSADGLSIATGAADGTTTIWSTATGKPTGAARWFMHPPQTLTFSPDRNWLACADDDGIVWLGHCLGGQEALALTDHNAPVRALAFQPRGEQLASAGDDGIRLWDPKTGKLQRSLDLFTKQKPVGVTAATYSPDGSVLVLGARDATIRFYHVADGRQLAVLTGHTKPVRALAFSPDSQLLASAGDDGSIRLWNAQTGAASGVLTGHGSSVLALAFSARHIIASAGAADDVIRLWNADKKQLLDELRGHENGVVTLSFSPTGTRLASGSFDRTIRLWDMDNRKAIEKLEGHTKVVNSVVFSSEGSRLISGSGDGTVRLWDVITRQELLKLTAGPREVSLVAVAARDGRRIACVSYDRIIRIWEADLSGREK